MWLVISLAAALAASAACLLLPSARGKRNLGFLALMLWGLAIMVSVDRAISFMQGGPLLEISTPGLIGNGALLGIAMLVPVLLIWAAATFTPLGRKANGNAAQL